MVRVLVIDEDIPFPLDAGKRIRTWNLLRRLAERHSVHLLCYGRPSDPGAEAVQKAGIRLCLVPPAAPLSSWRLYLKLLSNVFSPYPFAVTKHYSRRFQRQLDSLLENEPWDLIQCEWTPYARFTASCEHIPVLVATHNVESQILGRRASCSRNFLARLFFGMQEYKMRSFERRALLRASAVTTVTANDFDTVRHWGVKDVTVVPNGVDLPSFPPHSGAERDNEVLFLGSLDWYPNIDSLVYFLEQIFPLVRARRPEARLRIVGRRPSDALRRWVEGIRGVDFVGEVPDMSSQLDRAAVVIVPLRIGGGSRIKILEALAAGKAVVSTTIAAEGLEVTPGEELLIADSPTEFASHLEGLLSSKDKRRELGRRGHLLVSARYGWDDIASKLENTWWTLSKRPRSPETSAPS
jgi:glycosyltransferase involved in cell wall biosynthesis